MSKNHILKISNDAILTAQTKYMGVYIEEDLDETLLLLSLVKGRSKSTLIRDMLRESLDRRQLISEFALKLVDLLKDSRGESWEGSSPSLFKVWIREEIKSRRLNLSPDLVDKAFIEFDILIERNETQPSKTRKTKQPNEKESRQSKK